MFQSCLTWLFKLDMHCSQILILTKMKNLNVHPCITTQGLQIRYALLSNTYFDYDEKYKCLFLHHDSSQGLQIRYALLSLQEMQSKRGTHRVPT